MRIYRRKQGKTVDDAKEPSEKYRFSWIELISNTKTGETSATGFCGMILIFVPLVLFSVLVVWYFFNMAHSGEIFEILDKLTTWMMTGAGLLGLRKISGNFAGGSTISIGSKSKKKSSKKDEEDTDEEGE